MYMSTLEIKDKKYDILDVDENCTFRINIDVLNEAFGVGRGMYARACYPDKKNTFFAEEKGNRKFFIWMPKLYSNTSEWDNKISPDGRYIYEDAAPTRKEDWLHNDSPLNGNYRIVFIKKSPQDPYKFVGVFKDDVRDYMHHRYLRVAKKIRLIGNPVWKIGVLE